MSPMFQEQQDTSPVNSGVLASRLHAELADAINSRRMVEDRWMQDLRQYRGQYEPDVLKRLEKYKRSKVYYRLTTQKVNTMVARLMDLLFAQKTKNWSIEPTPDPVLPDDVIMAEMQDELAAGVQEIMAQRMAELQAQNIIPDILAV